MKRKTKEHLKGIEVFGNKHANYIRIAKFGEDDNRIFLEIGDCCVIIFRGIITVEMFTNFFKNAIFETGKTSVIDAMRSRMDWSEDVNSKYSEGCVKVDWPGIPDIEYM